MSKLLHVELEDLSALGWITITYVGDENVYFTTADGIEGYFKP